MSRHKMGICAVEGCGPKRIVGRGLCTNHWQLFKRNGTLGNYPRVIAAVGESAFSADGTKPCGTCKRHLPTEMYTLNPSKTFPLRRQSICKDCQSAQRKKLQGARRSAAQCLYCESPSLPQSDRCEFHRLERLRWRSTPKARVQELLGAVRVRCANKGLICTLDEEWIRSRLASTCEMTGLPFDLEGGKKVGRFNPYAPSIDRIIAGGNYTKENCRMVVMAINVGMNHWGEDTYRLVARAYLRNRREKKHCTVDETFNLLLENPRGERTRSH